MTLYLIGSALVLFVPSLYLSHRLRQIGTHDEIGEHAWLGLLGFTLSTFVTIASLDPRHDSVALAFDAVFLGWHLLVCGFAWHTCRDVEGDWS